MTVCTVQWDSWMYNEYEYICVELGFEQLFCVYRYKFLWKCDVSFYMALHCGPKKTWQYICDHNSGKTHSIFIIFALL